MDHVSAAAKLAHSLGERLVETPAADDRTPSRWFAVGDPQTSAERFFTFLDREGLVGEDGRLRADVGLLSIGDHFDYGLDSEPAARAGISILHWLASHPPNQVVLLAGNHDLARVQELAFETDESFAAARDLGRALKEERARDPQSPRIAAIRDEFHARFPHIPTPDIAARDYNAFRAEQRTTVQTLLLARRFALAAVATLAGHDALAVHAGFTMRELELLGPPSSSAEIARALNRLLDERVDRVRQAWLRGEVAALDLEPLHVAGTTGAEGGGLLYHRPANPDREGADAAWELQRDRPRRYDPRRAPRGLLQIVGHTGHKKSREELRPWLSAEADAVPFGGGLRTLRIEHGEDPRYELGVHAPARDGATLYMIDAGMGDARVEDVPLLPIDGARVPR